MNLQRREEIREMMHKPAGNMHEMYHDIIDMQQALSDMLAHIDTLEQTAAERVIARGAAVKPHTFAEIVNAVRHREPVRGDRAAPGAYRLRAYSAL